MKPQRLPLIRFHEFSLSTLLSSLFLSLLIQLLQQTESNLELGIAGAPFGNTLHLDKQNSEVPQLVDWWAEKCPLSVLTVKGFACNDFRSFGIPLGHTDRSHCIPADRSMLQSASDNIGHLESLLSKETQMETVHFQSGIKLPLFHDESLDQETKTTHAHRWLTKILLFSKNMD